MTTKYRFALHAPVPEGRNIEAHLTIRPLSSVQPEHAIDRADLGRLDQTRMRQVEGAGVWPPSLA